MLDAVFARGKKKKSGAGNAASCSKLGLDCSATCCIDTTCAVDMADCAGYTNRKFSELYSGVLIIIALLIGIPAIIGIVNFCIMHRFCKQVDEEDGTEYGGYTCFEMVVKIFSCCSRSKKKVIGDEEDDEE